MKELSLFDKFGILFSNIFQHPLFIVLLFVPIILYFLHKKHGNKVFVIVYFLSIIAILLIGGDELFKLFDNFMDGLFMVLYFPSFITLFIVALLSALFGFVSLFSSKMHKINKIINYVGFGIVQSMFILIILTVRSNNINIYKDNALYSNNDVLSLMQIMIGTFGIQVVCLVIINLINRVTSILDSKDSSISDSVSKQISLLSKYKLKSVRIDNDKVGFINVADKKKSSVPILKPFKFDIDKLQSVSLDVPVSSKEYNFVSLNGDETSYLNEIQSDYKPLTLNSSEVSYSNEVITSKRYKFLNLDSNKIVYLNTPAFDNLSMAISKSKMNSDYKIIDIDTDGYFNIYVDDNLYGGIDFIHKDNYLKKYKFFELDSNKNLNLRVSDKKFRKVLLNFDMAFYSNEIKKKYNVIGLNNDKLDNVTLNVKEKKKPFRFVDLKEKVVSYFEEVLKKPLFKSFTINSNDNFEFKSYDKDDSDCHELVKPDLLKPMDENVNVFYKNPMYAKTDNNKMSITGLVIMDMQSVLDVVSKCHLMKWVSLDGYNEKAAVDNLEISDFDLLSKALNKYVLIKNR